jgi:hypothetical protein
MQVHLPRSLDRISGLSAVVRCTSALHDSRKSLAHEEQEKGKKAKSFSQPTTKVCYSNRTTFHPHDNNECFTLECTVRAPASELQDYNFINIILDHITQIIQVQHQLTAPS